MRLGSSPPVRACATALAAVALLVAGHARADDEARARELFVEASAAVDGGHLAEARDLLHESLRLAPRTATAFNLAVVHRAMGEALAAVTLLDELLAGDYGDVDPRRRTEVERTRNEVRAELGTLVIAVHGSSAEVRVDGARVGQLDDGGQTRHLVDAGRHVVVATPPGGSTEERSVEVVRGEIEEASFDLDVVGEEGGSRIITSPWLWIAVAAVIGAAVAVTVVVATSGPSTPQDEVWGSAMTLSF